MNVLDKFVEIITQSSESNFDEQYLIQLVSNMSTEQLNVFFYIFYSIYTYLSNFLHSFNFYIFFSNCCILYSVYSNCKYLFNFYKFYSISTYLIQFYGMLFNFYILFIFIWLINFYKFISSLKKKKNKRKLAVASIFNSNKKL